MSDIINEQYYFKDASASQTINTIKNIIFSCNFLIKENITEKKISDFTSIISVNLEYPNLINGIMSPASGKGTDIESAMASAYAEFIERTSNKFIFHNRLWKDFGFSPDEKSCSCDELEDNILINKFNNNKKKLIFDIEKTVSENNKSYFLPFYNIKDKKIYYLPIKTLFITQTTNGMAAGNTLEEAIVQALSEIFERYAIREIFTKKISLPEIPEKYYIKYRKIQDIIQYYKQNEFSVKIKDASLNKRLPVVCAQITDKKNNTVQLSFGAHPCLIVAIEKSLIEILQHSNVDISDKDLFVNDKRFFSAKYFEYLEKDNMNLLTAACSKKLVFERNKFLNEVFFIKPPNYNFSELAWIKQKNKYTNKQLLNFIFKNVNLIKEKDIYIRNSSFLKFPSVYIYIPDISTINNYNTERINKLKNTSFIYRKLINNEFDFEISDLLNAIEYISKTRFNYINQITYQVPEEYIGLLCAIFLKKKKQIIYFADLLLTHKFLYNKFTKENIRLIKFIREYYEYGECCLSKYNQNHIQKLHKFINNINADIIKLLLKRDRNLVGLKELNIMLKKQNNEIEKLFEPVFKKNVQNQKNLSKIFEKIYNNGISK